MSIVLTSNQKFECGSVDAGGRRKKTYSKEKIANIMCDVDGQADIREMKTIAQPYQRQRNDMMPN